MRAPQAGALLLLTAGCATGPLSGTWTYDEVGVLEDTCGVFENASLPSGEFFIYNEGGGSLVLDPDNASSIFECTLDKDTVACPARVEESQTQADTTLTFSIGLSGSFEDRETLAGVQMGTLICEGAFCEEVEGSTNQDFPCTADVAFDAQFVSETLPE